MAALPYPPIAAAFLDMFPGRAESVIWENPSLGLFGIVIPERNHPPVASFAIPDTVPPPPTVTEMVVEVATKLSVPSIPLTDQCPDPPLCMHGKATLKRTVMRKDSPNIGRTFFVCMCTVSEGGNCGFFRWGDELNQYSSLRLRTPLTAEDVKRETKSVEASTQLEAWNGVHQGTERWLHLRACRITASNFGSVHRTNTFCSPTDLLRNILWPTNLDSVAMRYGTDQCVTPTTLGCKRSVNEKCALWRFSEWLSQHSDRPDLPTYIDEPGIWLSAEYPFLAGSPDGVTRDLFDKCTKKDSWPWCMKLWKHGRSKTVVAPTFDAGVHFWKSNVHGN